MLLYSRLDHNNYQNLAQLELLTISPTVLYWFCISRCANYTIQLFCDLKKRAPNFSVILEILAKRLTLLILTTFVDKNT